MWLGTIGKTYKSTGLRSCKGRDLTRESGASAICRISAYKDLKDGKSMVNLRYIA